MPDARRPASPGTEDTRRRVLDAALTLLSTEGPTALRVRRVAALAGCSTMGVYTWFGGMEGLLDAVLVEGYTSFLAALEAADLGAVGAERIRRQGRAYRAWARAHPAHYDVMFNVALPGHEPTPAVAEVGSRSFLILLDAVVDAQARGELGLGESGEVAVACWAALHGLVSLELRDRAPDAGAQRWQAAFDRLLDALLAGLATDGLATDGLATDGLATDGLDKLAISAGGGRAATGGAGRRGRRRTPDA